MEAFGAWILAGGVGLIVFLSLIGAITTIFWIVELVDAARRQFDSDLVKIIWLCVIFFFHVIGAIAYYIAGKPMGRLTSGSGSTF
jgi:hypothetical protein